GEAPVQAGATVCRSTADGGAACRAAHLRGGALLRRGAQRGSTVLHRTSATGATAGGLGGPPSAAVRMAVRAPAQRADLRTGSGSAGSCRGRRGAGRVASTEGRAMCLSQLRGGTDHL